MKTCSKKSLIVILCSVLLLSFIAGCSLLPKPAQPDLAPALAPPAAAEEPKAPVQPPAEKPLSDKEEAQKPTVPTNEGAYGPTLSDSIYEYNSRRYYYDDKTFGVGADKDYKGSAPRVTTDNSFTMRVYNIISAPDSLVDIDVDYDTDAREATGLLGEGDSYVTRDGIKITINKFFSNKFEFTLSKVDPEQHTPLCPDCVKISDIPRDTGVRFVNLREEKMYALKGNQYTFRVSEIDKGTSSAVLKVDTQELPLLEPGQTYVLRDGNAVKFLFAAAHQPTGYDGYGYAAFGFVPTTELPAQVLCPECTDFLYLRDGASQKFSYNNLDHTFTLQNRDGVLVLVYDNDVEAVLEAGNVVKVNDKISAKLLSKDVPRLIGLVVQGRLDTRTTCEPSAERDLFKQGRIRITAGSDEGRFVREDFCRDDSTLVDYACIKVPGREVSSNGHGRTAAMTVTTCACKDGACTK
ncbi:hypothetical protein HZB03_01700 [Candidatus Woesearchaeota archaeon]|nr:hypothetical protein [Candidatus Woesearchaeota archaeon]